MVSGLGLAFALHGKTQPFDVKLLHRGQVPGDQSYVIEACVSKHASILALRSSQRKSFLRSDTDNAPDANFASVNLGGPGKRFEISARRPAPACPLLK